MPSLAPPLRLPYTGLRLDRAAGQRGDQAWLRAVQAHPRSRLLPLWRDRCLVRETGTGPLVLDLAGADVVLGAGLPRVFLGVAEGPGLVFGTAGQDGAGPGGAGRPGPGLFAVDLSGLEETAALGLTAAAASTDTRSLFAALDQDQAAALAYARGLLRWHRDQQHCGRCGSPARADAAGHQRSCTGPGCGKVLFPRIEPAVITLVQAPGPPDRCLLGRPAQGAPGRWSLVAGFVDVGEGLEDAVRRECAEETGVTVGEVRYQGSQSWPYPAGLMIGFRAVASTEQITPDLEEVAEARWFTRPELASYLAEHPRAYGDSIGSWLLESWLAGEG